MARGRKEYVVGVSYKKVIEMKALSKYCAGCVQMESLMGTPEYTDWQKKHKCSINHVSSSGQMESDVAVEFFGRSVEKFNLRNMKYIGDGDTGSFSKVMQSQPYGREAIPEKLECVGHVQKRLGSRLRALITNHKGKLLDDKKRLTETGRLTKKAINTMQNFFGLAIRQNKDDLSAMKKSVITVLIHCCKNNEDDNDKDDIEELRNVYCPRGEKDGVDGSDTG